MCWTDIIIGKGESHCMAARLPDYPEMSQNASSFWISDAFMGIGLTIFKSSREGIRLIDMIRKQKSEKSVNNYLAKLVLKRAKPEFILEKFKEFEEKSFERGRNSIRNELKSLLQIED